MSLYGLIIGLALVIWFHQTNKGLVNAGKKPITALGGLFLVILMLVGARLYHVFDYWDIYATNPSLILSVNQGGLGIFGALLAGLAWLYGWIRRESEKPLLLTNLIMPEILLAQGVGRLANVINNELMPGAVIESVLCLLTYLIYKIFNKSYFGTAYYLIVYGVVRLISEQFRSDSWVISNINVATVFCLAMIVIGMIIGKYQADNRS